jgi:hypothetical protein
MNNANIASYETICYNEKKREEDKMSNQEDWIPMSQAARKIGVSLSKISRLALDGRIKSKLNPRDERVKLVDLSELKAMFGVK